MKTPDSDLMPLGARGDELMGVYGVFPRSRRAWISAQNAGGRQVRKPRFCSGFAGTQNSIWKQPNGNLKTLPQIPGLPLKQPGIALIPPPL